MEWTRTTRKLPVNAIGTHPSNDNDAVEPAWPKKLKCGFFGKLPSHENKNHAIETTAEPSYNPLYSLSNTKLAMLKKYIVN